MNFVIHTFEPQCVKVEGTDDLTAVSFLSTWKPKLEKEPSMETILEVSTPPKNIHHFCTVTNEYQLPEQFKHLGRKYHTPEQFLAPKQPFRVSI
jgi:hypothetical protein